MSVLLAKKEYVDSKVKVVNVGNLGTGTYSYEDMKNAVAITIVFANSDGREDNFTFFRHPSSYAVTAGGNVVEVNFEGHFVRIVGLSDSYKFRQYIVFY